MIEHRDASEADIRKVWDKAKACERHPHLGRLAIKPSSVFRVAGETLLVPMWRLEPRLVNLQFIGPSGHIWYGRDALDDTFVGFERRPTAAAGTVYICEGWPSAYALNAATGATAVAVFRRSSLASVAKAWRRFGDWDQLIAAAKNERWSYAKVAGWNLPNPGKLSADAAARKVGGRVAIPDFSDLQDHPTSFYDLWMREGSKAVQRCADPRHTEFARTRLPGHDVLDFIAREKVGSSGKTVIDLVGRVEKGRGDASNGGTSGTPSDAGRMLSEIGLLVKEEMLSVANQGSLQRLLDETWPHSLWLGLLRDLPGARATSPKYFTKRLTSRATAVPLDLLRPAST